MSNELIPKTAKESISILTELVLPNDTNTLNSMMGGKLLWMMDIIAGIAAQKHSNRVVVTASVDNVSFSAPIKLGNVVTLEAKVTRAFTTSMEVRIVVSSEDMPNRSKVLTNEAFYTMVAVDQNNKPVQVPTLIPETEEEQKLYHNALKRREVRLMLAGRLKAKDADELKRLFENHN